MSPFEAIAERLVRCEGGGRLAGMNDSLPDDLRAFERPGTPIGCNRLYCTTCRTFVRHRDGLSGPLPADWRTRTLAELAAYERRYECACASQSASYLRPPDPERTTWECAGHPTSAADRDALERAIATGAQVISPRMPGATPPSEWITGGTTDAILTSGTASAIEDAMVSDMVDLAGMDPTVARRTARAEAPLVVRAHALMRELRVTRARFELGATRAGPRRSVQALDDGWREITFAEDGRVLHEMPVSEHAVEIAIVDALRAERAP